MRRLMWRGLVVGVLAVLVAACGGSNDATAPSGTAVTETFSGTLVVNGAQTHTFSGGIGPFSITVNSISPTSVGYVGMAFGTWTGVSCTVAAVNENTAVGGGLQGSLKAAQTVCVKVYDVGTITSGNTCAYVVKAVHY